MASCVHKRHMYHVISLHHGDLKGHREKISKESGPIQSLYSGQAPRAIYPDPKSACGPNRREERERFLQQVHDREGSEREVVGEYKLDNRNTRQ